MSYQEVTHEARIRTIAVAEDIAALETVIPDADLVSLNAAKAIDFFNHGDTDVTIVMSGDTADDAPGITVPAGSVISFTAEPGCMYRVNDIAITFGAGDNPGLEIVIAYNYAL